MFQINTTLQQPLPHTAINQYQVVSKGLKQLEIIANNESIGRLEFKKWSSIKADIIAGNQTYQIAPKSVWDTTIEITKNNILLLHFTINWKGNIAITTKFTSIDDKYIFKQAGVFKNAYILLNEAGEKLLTIQPHYKWTKFTYNYTITTTPTFDDNPHQSLLLFTALYSVIYSMRVMTTMMI